MRFILALFAGAAMAADVHSPVKRDDSETPASAAITAIREQTLALRPIVESFSDIQGLVPLQTASQGLIDTITDAIYKVGNGSDMTIRQAAPLAQPIQVLAEAVRDTTQAVIDKRPKFDEFKIGAVVLGQLVMQRDLALQFSNITVHKTPAELQPLAQKLSNPIINFLNQGVRAFADLDPTGAALASTQTGAAVLNAVNYGAFAVAAMAMLVAL